jgi:hypothetical protein
MFPRPFSRQTPRGSAYLVTLSAFHSSSKLWCSICVVVVCLVAYSSHVLGGPKEKDLANPLIPPPKFSQTKPMQGTGEVRSVWTWARLHVFIHLFLAKRMQRDSQNTRIILMRIQEAGHWQAHTHRSPPLLAYRHRDDRRRSRGAIAVPREGVPWTLPRMQAGEEDAGRWPDTVYRFPLHLDRMLECRYDAVVLLSFTGR